MTDHRKRKQEHIEICLTEKVEPGCTGFNHYSLLPEAFPEMGLDHVDTAVSLLGRRLAFPFVIGAMSGGTGGDFDLNHRLARVAQKTGVALALGSMRPALTDGRFRKEYDVRSLAPDIPLFGNISAWQLRDAGIRQGLLDLCAELQLDGLFVHVNAAQELVQPEGERDFSGALEAVLALLDQTKLPIFLKDVGTGLATEHLAELVDAGIAGLDVAGRGGTNWPLVETLRRDDGPGQALGRELAGFGLPTATVLRRVDARLQELTGPGDTLSRKQPPDRPWLIASGGLRTPTEMALAIGLGADLVSAARPLLAAAAASEESLAQTLNHYHKGLRCLMLLSGCRSLEKLRSRVVPSDPRMHVHIPNTGRQSGDTSTTHT